MPIAEDRVTPVLAFLVEEQQIDAHAHADDREEGGEGDGLDGDAAGDPGACAQLAGGADVVRDGGYVDQHTESDEADSGIDGDAGVVGDCVPGGLEFAEEETEAGEGEADTHEAEAGANPGEEGALGSEVRARVIEFAGHRAKNTVPRWRAAAG
jgi:hypothetical protein